METPTVKKQVHLYKTKKIIWKSKYLQPQIYCKTILRTSQLSTIKREPPTPLSFTTSKNEGFLEGLGALALPRLRALPARIFWLRVSILQYRSLPTSSHLHRPKTPYFPLARGVPKPRDDDTKAKTCFLVVFHWSHAVPCPKSQGRRQKNWYRGSWLFFGELFFLGWDRDSFPFYCRPMSS